MFKPTDHAFIFVAVFIAAAALSYLLAAFFRYHSPRDAANKEKYMKYIFTLGLWTLITLFSIIAYIFYYSYGDSNIYPVIDGVIHKNTLIFPYTFEIISVDQYFNVGKVLNYLWLFNVFVLFFLCYRIFSYIRPLYSEDFLKENSQNINT